MTIRRERRAMDPHPAAARFEEAVRLRRRRLEDAASQGRKIIGYFCTYTPVEIIHACGFLPVRIWGGVGRAEKAYSLVPSFICPYMRLSLEGALNGEFSFLTGIVQGYTCDVACGLVNIWKDNFKMDLCHSLPLPYNDNQDARIFLRAGLHELAGKLTQIGKGFTDESLEGSLALYEEIRSILAWIFGRRADRGLHLTSAEVLNIVQAYFVTPPEEYLDMLKGLKDDLASAPVPTDCGIPVLISGSIIEDAQVLTLIEQIGFKVVADDLCTGQRGFTPVAGQGEGPMERLMDRIMKRFPCPSRSHPDERVPRLLDLIRSSRAKGVIFLFQKFCTPHLADHPKVSQALKDAGIPSILIEMDEAGLMEAQVTTRLETFYGMLE
jgi:benzoyl-CoA reductase/2-hydroxyglutaryl-CoA dehydratase subunit BcrC/BadD/HgdB